MYGGTRGMIEELDINPIDVFQEFFDSRIENVHTCIPAKIEKYDEDTRLASVKPLVKIKTRDGEDLSLPVIDNVPVIFPSSNKFTLCFPLEKGDLCFLLFTETGIGTWLDGNGDESNADDMSRFSLTDAVCIPGLYTKKSVPDPSAFIKFSDNGIEIKNDKSEIILKDDGIVEINGNADFAVAFNDLKTAFDQLKNDFNNFVTIKYNLHVHPGVLSGGASTAVTPATGTATAADMSNAKVAEVKLP